LKDFAIERFPKLDLDLFSLISSIDFDLWKDWMVFGDFMSGEREIRRD